MTKIRVTIDLDEADRSMGEHLRDSAMDVGVHGCDVDGVYHMYFHSRTDLVPFKDLQVSCPKCLNGWRRDVGPEGNDEECVTCNATGFVNP